MLPIDRELGNHFTSTSPASIFTNMRCATLPNPRGRRSLRSGVVTVEHDGHKNESPEPSGQAFLDLLKSHFGIELDAPYEALAPPIR